MSQRADRAQHWRNCGLSSFHGRTLSSMFKHTTQNFPYIKE